MHPPTLDPRLRAAVDASLAWYEALCALHGVRCGPPGPPATTPPRCSSPAYSANSGFTVLAHHRDGSLVGGAVTHLCTGVVELSNVWPDEDDLAWPDLLTTVAARHPGRAVVGYEDGAALDGALAAGFADLGPQHVWHRQ